MESFSVREQIVEVINKLFVYTDAQEWAKLQREVFTEQVQFDMSSLGGDTMTTTAIHICQIWKEGFSGIDAVNHLAGNYLINVDGNVADAFAYASATHYKQAATQGKTREFVGTYNLHLVKQPTGWRIDQFKYNLKFVNGNLDLV
jgi:hypothetical protein